MGFEHAGVWRKADGINDKVHCIISKSRTLNLDKDLKTPIPYGILRAFPTKCSVGQSSDILPKKKKKTARLFPPHFPMPSQCHRCTSNMKEKRSRENYIPHSIE